MKSLPPVNPRPNHNRPSRDEVLMNIAAQWEQMSTCDRAQVGAVIALGGRHIGSGYNGAPAGLPHCDHTFQGLRPAPPVVINTHLGDPLHGHLPPGIPLGSAAVKGCQMAIHAETNAIAYAARHGVCVEGATMYVTLSPCFSCAQLIIAAGLVRVVYGRTYRDRAGLHLLDQAGVDVEWWKAQ